MRKIKSMADIERVQRRNNIILGVFMIFLLTASSIGYSLMSADSEEANVVNEGGFDFVRESGMWKLVVGEDVFRFQNLPSEVGNVDVNTSAQFGQYSGQPLYFVNPGEGVSEILGNLGNYILRYQESCLQQDFVVDDLGNSSNLTLDEEENGTRINADSHGLYLENESIVDSDVVVCAGDLPVKDCDSNLIVFEVGNETRVYSEGNCVFIVGDVVLGSDAFLYKLLGVN